MRLPHHITSPQETRKIEVRCEPEQLSAPARLYPRGRNQQANAAPTPCCSANSVRSRADIVRKTVYPLVTMTKASDLPPRISDVMDCIEKMREELLGIQRSLEKLEPRDSPLPKVSKH